MQCPGAPLEFLCGYLPPSSFCGCVARRGWSSAFIFGAQSAVYWFVPCYLRRMSPHSQDAQGSHREAGGPSRLYGPAFSRIGFVATIESLYGERLPGHSRTLRKPCVGENAFPPTCSLI